MMHRNGASDDLMFSINRKDLERPGHGLYVYYELTNFYQNVRSYVESYDLKQLRGSASFSSYGLDALCNPVGGLGQDVPCGLLYESFPSEEKYAVSLELFQEGQSKWQKALELDGHVAKGTDRGKEALFGERFKGLEDWERKTVWMRPGAFGEQLKKLYGIISEKQIKGALREGFAAFPEAQLRLRVTAVGDYPFASERKVVIQQNSNVGGSLETLSLGQLSIAGGVVCLISGVAFAVVWFIQRKQGTLAVEKISNYEKHMRDPSLNDGIAPIPMVSAGNSVRKDKSPASKLTPVNFKDVQPGDFMSPLQNTVTEKPAEQNSEQQKPVLIGEYYQLEEKQ